MDRLMPVAWYHPTASSGPVPCRWAGWVDFGPSVGEVWVTVSLMGWE